MKKLSEAAILRYSSKLMLLKILQYSELKKRLQHRYFPVNIVTFLTTAFYGTPLATSVFKSN